MDFQIINHKSISNKITLSRSWELWRWNLSFSLQWECFQFEFLDRSNVNNCKNVQVQRSMFIFILLFGCSIYWESVSCVFWVTFWKTFIYLFSSMMLNLLYFLICMLNLSIFLPSLRINMMTGNTKESSFDVLIVAFSFKSTIKVC